MTTAAQALGVVRARLEASPPTIGGVALSLHWPNESRPLPDEPASFVYTEFLAEGGQIAGFGGGRGSNLYRHPARIESYVFVPNGSGLDQALTAAEHVASLFRSYRDAHISCFEATVHPGGPGADLKPPGLRSPVGNYFYSIADIGLFYDLIG